MPTHTIHSALVSMYHAAEGAPWSYLKWQETTGVGYGLFPGEDDQLPQNWTRQTAEDIRSYFKMYKEKRKEADRVAFSSSRASHIPGLQFWRTWVRQLWKEKGMQSRITSVLSEENLHPIVLMRHSTDQKWPQGAMYAVQAADAVGLELFGEDAMDGLGHVHANIKPSVTAIIQRTWNNLNTQYKRSVSRIGDLEEKAIVAFEDLDKDKLTKTKLQYVIQRVSRWKNLSEALQITENEEKIEQMEDELKILLAGLGGNVGEPKRNKRITKVTKEALESLASEENATELVLLYTELINTPPLADSIALQHQQPEVAFRIHAGVENSDPGVDVESEMPSNALMEKLGFTEGRLLLFNEFRHKGGLTPWEAPHLFVASEACKDTDMQAIGLQWHQLVGVHAIFRKVFSSKPDPGRCTGTLLADEVGLGKTYEAITTMAILSDLVMRQKHSGLKPPPLFCKSHCLVPRFLELKIFYFADENPFLQVSDKLQDLPHLVIVPGTVVSQWERELKILLKPNMFDILVYGSGKSLHEEFWADEGPYHSSKLSPCHRIIIAPHSALIQDYGFLYWAQKPSKKGLPWASPPRLPSYHTAVNSTLFSQKYLSLVLDEAHEFRNIGAKHSAALAIVGQATLPLIMTATPLLTSTKDIAAMGRLVGIPHFHSQKALEEERKDSSEMARLKRQLQEERAQGGIVDEAVRDLVQKIARRLQGQFDDRIICRTPSSLDWEGKRLIDLPECLIIECIVKLSPLEMKTLRVLSERVRENASVSNGLHGIVSRSFYLEYRMGVCYPRVSLKDPLPTFNTLQEWTEIKSTKFDICARMCQYILSRDDAPDVTFENGEAIFPPVPSPAPGQAITQETKILIYQDFPSLGALLRKVLSVYGVKSFWIDGDASFDKRAKIVSKFRESPDTRVLIISSVGANGLNLAFANTLIFLDQPWSGQDEKQIRGRVHRQPQKKVVKCYHLLAADTADIILSGLARGKKDMMESFLEKPDGREMFELLSGRDPIGDGDDSSDLENEPKKGGKERQEKKTKGKAKQKGGAPAKESGKKSAAEKKKQDVIEKPIEISAPTIGGLPASSEDGITALTNVERPSETVEPMELDSIPPSAEGKPTGTADELETATPIPGSSTFPFPLSQAPKVGDRRRRRSYSSSDNPAVEGQSKRPKLVVDYPSSPIQAFDWPSPFPPSDPPSPIELDSQENVQGTTSPLSKAPPSHDHGPAVPAPQGGGHKPPTLKNQCSNKSTERPPSSCTYGRPSSHRELPYIIRRPTLVSGNSRNRKLSPPPSSVQSRNPYSTKGANR